MAVRWVAVYKSSAKPARGRVAADGDPQRRMLRGPEGGGDVLVPPERHFPLTVVVGHGVFAFTTVVLVLLTTLGIGGS